MSAARDVGAKMVLIDNPKQLQAIEAGVAEITEVWRQRQTWQWEVQPAKSRVILAYTRSDMRALRPGLETVHGCICLSSGLPMAT